jgi:hypothetical protein
MICESQASQRVGSVPSLQGQPVSGRGVASIARHGDTGPDLRRRLALETRPRKLARRNQQVIRHVRALAPGNYAEPGFVEVGVPGFADVDRGRSSRRSRARGGHCGIMIDVLLRLALPRCDERCQRGRRRVDRHRGRRALPRHAQPRRTPPPTTRPSSRIRPPTEATEEPQMPLAYGALLAWDLL